MQYLRELQTVQKLYLKSFQYYVFLLTTSMLMCLLPILAAVVSGSIWITMAARVLRYASAMFMCSYVYGRADDVNLFIVPASFLPLPIIYQIALSSVRKATKIDFGLHIWRTSTLFDFLSFILPMIVATYLISRYMELQKKKGAEYSGSQTLRKNCFVAAAIPAAIAAACCISMALLTFIV